MIQSSNRESYWQIVERTLVDIFNIPKDEASDKTQELRQRVTEHYQDRQPELFYHQEKYDVARQLAGIESDDADFAKHREQYFEIVNEVQMSKAHVMVVDDSITTRTQEKDILQAAGYTVTTAASGAEALKKLRALNQQEKNPVDLILCDIRMPEMDGFELSKKLKKSSKFRNLPVILFTSSENPQEREEVKKVGVDYIVRYEFNQAEFLATIQKVLPS